MTYPLVSELADAWIPVTVSCRVLKLARQPYYRWRNDPVRDADMLRAYRINALHDAHHDDPTFGYRYLADEARRAGWRMSRRTAWKLCSQAGILSSQTCSSTPIVVTPSNRAGSSISARCPSARTALLAVCQATPSPAAIRVTARWSITSASSAHLTPPRDSFAFGSAARVVSSRHEIPQVAHR